MTKRTILVHVEDTETDRQVLEIADIIMMIPGVKGTDIQIGELQ